MLLLKRSTLHGSNGSNKSLVGLIEATMASSENLPHIVNDYLTMMLHLRGTRLVVSNSLGQHLSQFSHSAKTPLPFSHSLKMKKNKQK